MAKRSERKNRSTRKRLRIQEELVRSQEKKEAELDKELKLVLGSWVVASVLLAVIVTFALKI